MEMKIRRSIRLVMVSFISIIKMMKEMKIQILEELIIEEAEGVINNGVEARIEEEVMVEDIEVGVNL